MAQQLSERQQRAAERILEDEGLTADLTDTAARALTTWASEQASALAGDTGRSDEQLQEALAALRKAIRTAAASGEEEPAALIAQVQKALAPMLDTPHLASQPALAPQVAEQVSVDSSTASSATNVPQSAAQVDIDAHLTTTESTADSASDKDKPLTNSDQQAVVKPKPARPPKPPRPPKPASKPKPAAATATTDQRNIEANESPHVPDHVDQPAALSEEHLSSEEQYARWLQNIENDNQE